MFDLIFIRTATDSMSTSLEIKIVEIFIFFISS